MLGLGVNIIGGVPGDPDSISGVTSCSVADFRKMISNADRMRLSVPVIVVYGVDGGLPNDGLHTFKLNELVFFRIDFFGCIPNIG